MLIARNIALIVLAFWCGVNAMAQSQESPPQAPQIQTEQQPDSAAKSQSQSEQDTRPTNQIPPPDQNIQAENSHRNAEGNADKRAEETREYWPFLILGARLKIGDCYLVTAALDFAIPDRHEACPTRSTRCRRLHREKGMSR